MTIGPREFCGFPRGTYHRVVEVHPPIECLILRGPSGSDKQYLLPDGTTTTDRTYHQDILGLPNGGSKLGNYTSSQNSAQTGK